MKAPETASPGGKLVTIGEMSTKILVHLPNNTCEVPHEIPDMASDETARVVNGVLTVPVESRAFPPSRPTGGPESGADT